MPASERRTIFRIHGLSVSSSEHSRGGCHGDCVHAAAKTKIDYTGTRSGNPVRERRANHRGRILVIRTNEKGDRSVEVTNPDLGRARIKVERTFFLDLGGGVRRRKDLDANVWGAPKNSELANILGSLGGEPGDIDGFDASRGGHRAFGHGAAIGKQLTQQETDINLALAVERSRRRTHENVTVLIGFDAIGELNEVLISQNLGPTSQVKPGLRLKIREFDSDWHGQYYTRSETNA